MNSKSFYGIFTSALCLLVLSVFTPKTAHAQYSCELLLSEPSLSNSDFPVYAKIEQIRQSKETTTNNIFQLLQLFSDVRSWSKQILGRITADLSNPSFKDISFSQIIYEDIIVDKAESLAEEMPSSANHFATYSQYKAALKLIYQEVETYRNYRRSILPFEVRVYRVETLLLANEKFQALYNNDRGAALNLVRNILSTRSQTVSDMVDKVAGKLPRPKHLSEIRQEEAVNYSNIENLRKSALPPQVKRGPLTRALQNLPQTKDLSAEARNIIINDLLESDYAEVSAGQLINENMLVSQAIALKMQKVATAFSESSVINGVGRFVSRTEYDIKLAEIYNAVDVYRKNENHAFSRLLVVDRITNLIIADLRFSVGKELLDEGMLLSFLKNLFDEKNQSKTAQQIADELFRNGHH